MNAPARRGWRAALIVGGLAFVAALAFDQHYAPEIEEATRDRVRARMEPFADALRGAVQRRIGVIVGLRSFVDGRRTRADLEAEFPAYARGAIVGTAGIRAIEFIDGGVITMIEPLAGNEPAVGFDLARDPRPRVRADYARALAARRPLVTGPVRLVEGGTALLLRLRLTDRDGFPEIATVVFDVPTILADAGIPDARSGLRLAVVMTDGSPLGGDALRSDERPEQLAIPVEQVEWSLQGAPVEGWARAASGWRLAMRGTLAALVLVLALIAYAIGIREDRLVRAAVQAGSTLDLALRAGRMGVLQVDPRTGAIRWSGPAAVIFGFDSAAVPDAMERVYAMMAREDALRLRRSLREALAGEREHLVEEFRLQPDEGAARWVLLVAHIERGPDGRAERVAGAVSDVTERHALEDQLRQSQRLEAVGKLAGGVAHDFNNLLTAITGFAELARARAAECEGPAADAVVEDLQQVIASAQRGASLTAQLLAFSRRAPALPSRVDLSRAVAELQPILERLFSGRVEILAHLANDLPDIRAEMGQLTQVILNLLVHARDAMPEGGTVTVRTFHVPAGSGRRPIDAPPGAWGCLEVQDAPSAHVGEATGAGLGLAVVHGAVENAGGHITVQPAPTSGSIFRVYLPLWHEPA